MLPCQRHLFSLPEDAHYLNCSYFHPLLKCQREAMNRAMDELENPSGIDTTEAFFDRVDELRALLGQLVNASPEQVCLVPSVSYGIAIATQNLQVRKGQNVVVPAQEFPSDVYGWEHQCRTNGAELRLVPRPTDVQRPGEVWSERMLEAIDANTAVVNLTAVHWSDGTRFDLPALRQRATEVGAALVLDGTQSVGALPFDVQAVQPDLLVVAGYKWMMGPYSLGFAVVGERFLDGAPVEHSWAARANGREVGATLEYSPDYDAGARRFDMGERGNLYLLPLFKVGVRQVLEWTTAGIQEYTGTLANEAERELAETGYTMQPRSERGNHLFGITLPDPALLPRVQAELKQRNVSISYRKHTLRVSPHVYNTPADIQALVEGLKAARA